MTITLHSKGYLLIHCNSCSINQNYNKIPKICDICNSTDIELYINGKNKTDIKEKRIKYNILEKFIKNKGGYYEISLDK